MITFILEKSLALQSRNLIHKRVRWMWKRILAHLLTLEICLIETNLMAREWVNLTPRGHFALPIMIQLICQRQGRRQGNYRIPLKGVEEQKGRVGSSDPGG